MTPLRGIAFAAVLGLVAVATIEVSGVAGQEMQQTVRVQTSTTQTGSAGQNQVQMGPVQQNGTGLIVGQIIEAGSDRGVPGAIVTLGGGGTGVTSQQVFQVITMGPGGSSSVSSSGSQNTPRLITDSEGRFAFRNVPKGTFNIQATKPGYLDGAYGRLRPNGATQTLDLADGERTGDVRVRLFRAASIGGTVIDDLGEPVVGVQLRAYRRSLVSGRRLLTAAAGTSVTDDRGMYRLGSLVPGEYVVAMQTLQSSMPASMQLDAMLPDLMSTLMSSGGGTFSLNNSGTPVTPDGKFTLQSGNGFSMAGPTGRMLVFPTQYYPSSNSASQATPVVVGSGEDRTGIDLQLKLVPTVNVSGRLIGPDGPAANYALHLIPGDTTELSSDPDVATTITDAQGEFQFLAVPAGQYVIQTVRMPRGSSGGPVRTMFMQSGGSGAVSFATSGAPAGSPFPPSAPAAAPEPTLWLTMPVSLGDTDITDLLLNLRGGSKISGKVDFDGAADRPTADKLSSIAVIIESADGKQKSVPQGRVDASGQFTVPGLLPGKYVLRASNAPSGWTFKGASIGGADMSDTAFDVEDKDVNGVTLTFFDRPTELKGIVRGTAGVADAAAAVVVFPADTRSWMNYGVNPRRMRMVRTSKTGNFQFAGLPAGDYYVAAVSDEVAGEWQDPQFLDALSRVGTRVPLGEGQKSSQDLQTQNVRPGGGLEPAPIPADDDAAASAHGPFVDDTVGDTEQVQTRDTRPQTPAPARDAAAAPSTGTASIAGVVLLDDGSLQPVRRARVTARGSDGHTERIGATDDNGRFSIGALPAGHYTVMVTKASYLTAYYGSKRPGRGPGIPIAIATGQAMTNLNLKMARGAVISGTVRDDYGLPVAAAAVRVMQFRTVNGERTMTGQQSAITDDRGVYRVYSLQAAAYVVCVTPPPTLAGQNELRQLSTADLQTAVNDLRVSQAPGAGPTGAAGGTGAGRGAQLPSQPVGKTVGFAPVYYPGTLMPGEASTVPVSVGQEITGIDIPLRLIGTARVEGSVVGADGRPASGVSLNLISSDAAVTGTFVPRFISTNDQGKFSITNVAPGHYTLSARGGGTGGPVRFGTGDFLMGVAAPVASAGSGGVPPPPPPPPVPMAAVSPLYATADVDVNGENITDLALTLQDGMTIAGRLVFAGKGQSAPANLTKTRVSLVPAASGGLLMGVPDAVVDATGAFKFVGIPPGKYRIASSVFGGGQGTQSGGTGAAAGWALRSAVVDGHDALDSSLEIRPGQNVQGMVITFTDQPTEVSGTLIDTAGKPISGFSIVVFSTDRTNWTASSRRVSAPIQVSSDGKYKAAGLPPGEYFLAALTDYEPGDLGDAGFLEQVAGAAIKITLGEGEKKVQDLKIAG